MSNGFVGDGYDLDGFIQASPETKSGQRIYDSLEFKYRPATRIEVVKHDAEVQIASRDDATDPEAAVNAEKKACEFVAKKVKQWDLKDRNEKPVAITSDNCARLNAMLFSRLYLIIRGSQVSDPKSASEEALPSDEDLQKN